MMNGSVNKESNPCFRNLLKRNKTAAKFDYKKIDETEEKENNKK